MSIEFDYIRAKQQADQLDTIAKGLNKLAQEQYDDTLRGIAANWQGESAESYVGKGNILKENIVGSSKELHKIADDIRIIAKRIYDAEMAARARARRRNY